MMQRIRPMASADTYHTGMKDGTGLRIYEKTLSNHGGII